MFQRPEEIELSAQGFPGVFVLLLPQTPSFVASDTTQSLPEEGEEEKSKKATAKSSYEMTLRTTALAVVGFRVEEGLDPVEWPAFDINALAVEQHAALKTRESILSWLGQDAVFFIFNAVLERMHLSAAEKKPLSA